LTKAERWLGSRSRAAPTISLTLAHLAGLSIAAPLHLSSEPSLRNVPLSFGRRARNTKDFGSLFGGQTAEEAEFDQAALLLIDLSEGLQGVVEGDNVGVAQLWEGFNRVELDAAVGATLGGAVAARIVDKNL